MKIKKVIENLSEKSYKTTEYFNDSFIRICYSTDKKCKRLHKENGPAVQFLVNDKIIDERWIYKGEVKLHIFYSLNGDISKIIIGKDNIWLVLVSF